MFIKNFAYLKKLSNMVKTTCVKERIKQIYNLQYLIIYTITLIYIHIFIEIETYSNSNLHVICGLSLAYSKVSSLHPNTELKKKRKK